MPKRTDIEKILIIGSGLLSLVKHVNSIIQALKPARRSGKRDIKSYL